MSTSLRPAIEIFRLHTRLFRNVTRDINDEHAQTPIGGTPMGGSPNHIAWITGHIVSNRYMLATILGLTAREPFAELFESGKGIQEDARYPSMKSLADGWDALAEKVIAKLESLTEDDLEADPPIATPVVSDNTLRGFITFLAHHEAYHIGQLSLARRFFGYEAMEYA
jgi:hypothetical protein